MSQSEEGTLDISAGRIFYKNWYPTSPGSGVPVVLMHESLGCIEMWRDYPQRLSDRLGRTVIAYDRLGFGRSSRVAKLPGPDFVKKEATDVFPVLRDYLCLEDFIVYGHSIGGAMAVEVGALFQHSCSAVVAESALPFVDENSFAGVAAAKKAYKNEALLGKLRKYHGDKVNWVLSAWTDAWFLPEFADWNLFDALRNNRRPLLAIHGENDEYGSPRFPETIGRISGGPTEILIIPGCGHAPHREATHVVLDHVESFFNRLATRHRPLPGNRQRIP